MSNYYEPAPDPSDDDEPREWECGSCGACIDAEIAFIGEPFHWPDADCRSVHSFDAHDRAAWEKANR